jgi:hypothetical protein
MSVVLDDAERQSIREWFRSLVRSRTAAGGAEDDEGSSLTGDLDVPRDVASEVRGGSDGGSSESSDDRSS